MRVQVGGSLGVVSTKVGREGSPEEGERATTDLGGFEGIKDLGRTRNVSW